MELLAEYGLFLAKVVTLIIGLLLLVGGVSAAGMKMRKSERKGHIEVENLNEHYEEMRDALQAILLPEDEYKSEIKSKEKKEKQEKKSHAKEQKLKQKQLKKSASKKTGDKKADGAPSEEHDEGLDKEKDESKKRIFVFDFDGDIRASENHLIESIITAILGVAKNSDEVVLRLESPGGMVHSYGLAASQLQRIKNKGIPLTICVDKVAASGGYMMACLGDKIIAAPFAMIGSIGVLAQIPNFNRLLKKHDIDYELITAGEHKRTLTMLGENTEKGRKKFEEDIQDTHDLFKEFVQEARPAVEIGKVATGEVWFGKRALALNLIDELQTSEEYLQNQIDSAEIFKVSFAEKRSLQEKIGLAAQAVVLRVTDTLIAKDRNPLI